MLRLRGIYSTALTRLLSDMGFSFSDVTPIIKKRFRGEIKILTTPPLVTIKDREDFKGVVIIGAREPAEKLFYSILHAIQGSFGWFTPMGPYTTVAVRITGKVSNGYEVELPGGNTGILLSKRKREKGDIVKAHIIKPSVKKPLLKEGIALIGVYARVIENSPHSVSNFIKSEEKKLELLQLAFRHAPQGWGVKFRSSASSANIVEIAEEISRLVNLGEKLAGERYTSPALVNPGEAFGTIFFPPDAQRVLDGLRSRQIVTMPLHHELKSLGIRDLDNKIDFAERIVNDRACFSTEALRNVYRELLGTGGEVVLLHHYKITGDQFTWMGVIDDLSCEDLVLKRTVVKPGIYDGINIEKTPGDTITSYTAIFSRFILHSYSSSDGALKGLYVNINTPIGVYEKNELWYVDLEVDIVWDPSNGVRIVDNKEWLELQALDVSSYYTITRYTNFVEAVRGAVASFSGDAESIEKLFYRVKLEEKEIFENSEARV